MTPSRRSVRTGWRGEPRRWLPGLLLCAGCAGAPAASRTSAPSSRAAILAPAGDTLLAAVAPPGDSGRALYVADALTAEALAPAARRMGFALRAAPSQVWCGDPARDGRAVGTTVRLRVDSLAGDRARVRWSVTCLLLPLGESTPTVGGEMGVLEVVRERGQWRVTRSLLRLAL